MAINWTVELLNLALDNVVSWESIARECIAQMPEDCVRDVCVALGVDDEIERLVDDNIEDGNR